MPYPYHYDNEHKPDDHGDFDLPTLHKLVQSFKDFIDDLLEKRKTDAKD